MQHYDDDEESPGLRAWLFERLASWGWVASGLALLVTGANHLTDLFLLIAR